MFLIAFVVCAVGTMIAGFKVLGNHFNSFIADISDAFIFMFYSFGPKSQRTNSITLRAPSANHCVLLALTF